MQNGLNFGLNGKTLIGDDYVAAIVHGGTDPATGKLRPQFPSNNLSQAPDVLTNHIPAKGAGVSADKNFPNDIEGKTAEMFLDIHMLGSMLTYDTYVEDGQYKSGGGNNIPDGDPVTIDHVKDGSNWIACYLQFIQAFAIKFPQYQLQNGTLPIICQTGVWSEGDLIQKEYIDSNGNAFSHTHFRFDLAVPKKVAIGQMIFGAFHGIHGNYYFDYVPNTKLAKGSGLRADSYGLNLDAYFSQYAAEYVPAGYSNAGQFCGDIYNNKRNYSGLYWVHAAMDLLWNDQNPDGLGALNLKTLFFENTSPTIYLKDQTEVDYGDGIYRKLNCLQAANAGYPHIYAMVNGNNIAVVGMHAYKKGTWNVTIRYQPDNKSFTWTRPFTLVDDEMIIFVEQMY